MIHGFYCHNKPQIIALSRFQISRSILNLIWLGYLDDVTVEIYTSYPTPNNNLVIEHNFKLEIRKK